MNDSGLGSFKPDTVVEECRNELDTLKAENKALREQLSTALTSLAVSEKQIADGEADRAQLQAQLDRTLAELAELQEKSPPPTEQPPIDLSEQVAQTINFLKELLPPDTKWPKRVMPKLREHLESKEG